VVRLVEFTDSPEAASLAERKDAPSNAGQASRRTEGLGEKRAIGREGWLLRNAAR